MFVEGANYIVMEEGGVRRASCYPEVMRWGFEADAAEDGRVCMMAQMVAGPCHDTCGGNIGIILAFQLLRQRRQPRHLMADGESKKLSERAGLEAGRGLRVTRFIRLCLSVFCGIILPISQVFLSCQLVGIENFSSQLKPTTERHWAPRSMLSLY